MTASKTPNLGLMSPTITDPFTTQDFADTMAILDQHPGIRVIPNQAARPTGWTSAQHGRRVYQADQQIEWAWHRPDNAQPGVWKRTYPKGLLVHVANYSTISTTNTNYSAGSTLVESGNVIIPGGRDYYVTVRCEWIGNSSGMAIMSIFQDNSMVTWLHFGHALFDGGRGMPAAAMFTFPRAAPTNQITTSFKATLSAHTAFGGSSVCWGPTIEVGEQ